MNIYQPIYMEQEIDHFLNEKIAYYKSNTLGSCASYIPELAKANPDHLGCTLVMPDGSVYSKGDYEIPFTIQSISKVVTFIAACLYVGTSSVLEWVDVEPTGGSFNSFDLSKDNKPFNPMINAGALTVASLIPGAVPEEKIQRVTHLLSTMVNREVIINEKVFHSEWETAYRNRALASLLMENKMLAANVEDTLETYIKLCSIEVLTSDLAKIGLILSHDGFDPIRKIQIIPSTIARLAKVVMFTCGMYNASGKAAAFVGIPAKSGVSGGILGVIPASSRNHPLLREGCGIGIYGPAIDEKGNSVKGMQLLESFLRSYSVQIF